MLIYILLFLYIISACFLFRENRKLNILLITIPLVLLASLRSIELGVSDTKGVYLDIFNNMNFLSIIDVIKWRGFNEILFFMIFKIITIISYNYRLVLFLLCLPYIIIVSKHIYKYSKNYLVSFIVFIAMYYLFSFYLIKQCFAVGILILSYDFIIEKKPKKFIAMVLLATLIHKMSLIFIIAYPLANKLKFSYKNYIYILIGLIVSRLLPGLVYFFIDKFDYTGTLINYINHGVYSVNENVSTFFGFLINVVILIYCSIFCNENDQRSNADLNFLTIGCILFSFSSIILEFYRVSLFFNIFGITRISNFERKVGVKNKLLLNIILCLTFILYFLFVSSFNYNANPYIFFWE